MWVRGLKRWSYRKKRIVSVAPYVGAWIETELHIHYQNCHFLSHPMWVRGLKPDAYKGNIENCMSHPMWVRGLKLNNDIKFGKQGWVAPYVGAWIETDRLVLSRYLSWSHPMWVRGLKHNTDARVWSNARVAPYVGAWIETSTSAR